MTPLIVVQRPVAYAITEAFGWSLMHFLWQGALVAVVLWCALALIPHRSTNLRYAAGCFALLAMVILPVITFAPLAIRDYRLVTSGVAPLSVAEITINAGDGTLPRWWAWSLTFIDADLPWLILTWSTGVLLFSCRLILGMSVARRLKLRGTGTVSECLQTTFLSLCRRFEIHGGVALLHSAEVQVPTVIGWLKPVVLLPLACLSGLPELQIEAVLAHELAHIRRRDYLVSVLQSVVEAVLFYHPAVWWVSRQIRRERECCCDDLAVNICGDRMAYARALSLLEERRALLPDPLLRANGGVLTMRIKRLLCSREDNVSSNMARAIIAAVIIAAIGGVVSSIAYAESKLDPTNLFHPQGGSAVSPLKDTVRGSNHVLAANSPSAAAQQAQAHQTAPSARPVTVAGDVMAGQVISRVDPIYPPDAKAARVQGQVKLKVTVTSDGSVHNAQVLSGPKELYRSSIDAVSQWKYKPYLLNGKPVDVETVVNINYALAS